MDVIVIRVSNTIARHCNPKSQMETDQNEYQTYVDLIPKSWRIVISCHTVLINKSISWLFFQDFVPQFPTASGPPSTSHSLRLQGTPWNRPTPASPLKPTMWFKFIFWLAVPGHLLPFNAVFLGPKLSSSTSDPRRDTPERPARYLRSVVTVSYFTALVPLI